jgi:hypothetical protein
MSVAYQYDQRGQIVRTDGDGSIWTFPQSDDNGDWRAIRDDVAAGRIVIGPASAPALVFSRDQPVVSPVVRTTDATATEVYRVTLAALTGYAAVLTLLGVDAGNGACRVIRASVAAKRLNAGALLVGAPVVLASHADAAATTWAIAASVSGNDFVVTCAGAAGRTVDWHVTGAVQSFTPAGA